MQNFSGQYLNLFFLGQKAQWENYADRAEHNLNNIDAEIYQLLAANQELLTSSRDVNLQRILLRGLVDKDPEVSMLRNRLDSQSAYLYDNPSRSTLAIRMKPDVLKLMVLRNQKAKVFGFANYPELVFHCEGLDREQVKQTVSDYLETNLLWPAD
ncbi:MAG: hypothetical protein FH749_08325 [Firmicutes bacterium]|nr:hypothetical protein [Bacillota bacterium]